MLHIKFCSRINRKLYELNDRSSDLRFDIGASKWISIKILSMNWSWSEEAITQTFDGPSCSLPPADFMQLSVRKSANCLSLSQHYERGGGETSRKTQILGRTLKIPLHPHPRPIRELHAQPNADHRNRKHPSLLGCVRMCWSYLSTAIIHPSLHLFSFFTPHAVLCGLP